MKMNLPELLAVYLQGFLPETRRIQTDMREVIRKEDPDATATIKYGIPTFAQNENKVRFSEMKHHIGFYPRHDCLHTFGEKLMGYRCSKGAVQFSYFGKIPYALIVEMVVWGGCKWKIDQKNWS